MAQIGRCLAQSSSGGTVSDRWILFDSCYTISCAKNISIISNVTVIPPKEHLRFYSNRGHMECTMRGTLDILSMGIYVNDNSMANILSLKEVAYSFRMTMDIKEDHTMLVHYRKDKSYRLSNVERACIISTSLTQKSSHWRLIGATPIILSCLLWMWTWSTLPVQILKEHA